ncbi:MAG: hypothetical protein GY768_13340 [Planctomycetaceae bacterium]|nr:hypothetical protein [Planctomycetaceae bacterium]
MSEARNHLDDLVSELKKQRDELALQINLGKAEAKEEWAKITSQLDQLSQDYEPMKDAVGESAESIFSALKLVGEEIQNGFHRIRKTL